MIPIHETHSQLPPLFTKTLKIQFHLSSLIEFPCFCSRFTLKKIMATNEDGSNGESSAAQLPFARSYQIEALEQAIKQNTIVFLETGSGKTLIAIMLLRHYASLLRKPSPFIAVFLVPTVVLVKQQAENVRRHVDLKVEEYWGEKGVDFWKAADWKKQQDENQLMVMTPQILLNALSHSFLSLDTIKLLIFDECHHAKKKHTMALIMKFYHRRLCDGGSQLPRVLGLTASPVEAKVSNSGKDFWEQINNLETVMNSKVYTCSSESVLSGYIPFSTTKFKSYENNELPYHILEGLKSNLSILRQKHESKVSKSTLSEYGYVKEQVQYVPPELVGFGNNSSRLYYFYLIKLKKQFDYNIPLQDIVLAVSTKLDFDSEGLNFDLEADRGIISVSLTYIGTSELTSEQITLTNQFQMTVLRVLIDRTIEKLENSFDSFKLKNDDVAYDYLLLPSAGPLKAPMIVEWKAVQAAMFPYEREVNDRMCNLMNHNHQKVHTKNGLVCSCFMENSLVHTPHNGRIYCTTGRLLGLNGNSHLEITEGNFVTYKSYYKTRHGVNLMHEEEPLFAARQLFTVRNCLHKSRLHKDKETSSAGVELPSELCDIIMSPVSISTFYSFSFVPSIMHRIESWSIALNLKKMHIGHSMPNGNVPASKVLEAITTKKCEEKFHLESLETLGDSFLKYAASQQLFKNFQDQHQGILTSRREKIISNVSLCRLGCNANLPGFIRNEPFEPKTWVVPGDRSRTFNLEDAAISDDRKMYIRGKRVIKKKVVADVVEALIGVFLSEGGEMAALSFMSWLGITVDFVNTPYTRALTLQPEKFLNIQHLESLLNYSFNDASLLVEALTHGSYMRPEIPKCYQRLEFLGDAVLDYLITVHLYSNYPGMSPGMLTDMRSASVNNDCFAQSAVKAELHKHILHTSQDLQQAIDTTVRDFAHLSMETTFGWESETSFPKVLADVIESLAGAIFVDSGYNKDRVFQSIRPLLEPLVTPETFKLHPVRELGEICQKNHYKLNKSKRRTEPDNGAISFTIEVVVTDNDVFKDTCMAANKEMAERLASKSVLKKLKKKLAGHIIL